MKKDRVKGRTDETKGKTKEVAGHIAGNKDLELEHDVRKNVGKGQSEIGDIKKKAKKGR